MLFIRVFRVITGIICLAYGAEGRTDGGLSQAEKVELQKLL